MGKKSADSPSQDQLHINDLDQDQEQGDMCNEADELEDCSDDALSGDSHYQEKDETEVNKSSKKRKRPDTSRDPAPVKRLGLTRKEMPTGILSIPYAPPYYLRSRPANNFFNFAGHSMINFSQPIIGPITRRQLLLQRRFESNTNSSLADGYSHLSKASANNGPTNGQKPTKNKLGNGKEKVKDTKNAGKGHKKK